jgi:hypothetical protein
VRSRRLAKMTPGSGEGLALTTNTVSSQVVTDPNAWQLHMLLKLLLNCVKMLSKTTNSNLLIVNA